MNLHEECLLKYLLNPLNLLHTTEQLKINNILLEKTLHGENSIVAKPSVNYSRI